MTIHREWHSLVSSQLSSSPRPPQNTKPSRPPQHAPSISWCTLLSIIPPPRCYRGPRSRRVLLSWDQQEILMTGAQVMSARSSQPPNTALIRAPRPNTGCDPVQPRHYVTSQPWSGHKYSVQQMLWYSALRSSSQPSRQVSHFCLSPHLFVYLNANLL